MAINEKLTSRLRILLEHLPDVEEKKMFRGITFMVNGKMCVSVGDDRIMCRIDPALHEEAVQQPGCQTVVMKGREYKGYVHVQEANLGTKKNLAYWVGLCLDFNQKARASVKKKK